jgi:hypothetical protein
MSREGHFAVAPNVHARRFDDETVILHLDAGEYFSLDAVGTLVWEQLQAGRSLDEAVAAVVADFDVDGETARADADRLVRELVAVGILKARDA